MALQEHVQDDDGQGDDHGPAPGQQPFPAPSKKARIEMRWQDHLRKEAGRGENPGPAAISDRSDVLRPWKKLSPSGAVRRPSSETITSTSRNSFHVHMNSS